MADCFSLPNAEELVEILRRCGNEEDYCCKECKFVDVENNMCMNVMILCAADAIEALMQRVKESESIIDSIRKKAEEEIEALIEENAELKEQAQRGSDYHILKSERDGFKQENAKLKAERDDWRQKYLSSEADATNLTGLLVQAVADIPRACGYCKWFRDTGKVGCFCKEPCRNISGVNTQWEWRGVKENEKN